MIYEVISPVIVVVKKKGTPDEFTIKTQEVAAFAYPGEKYPCKTTIRLQEDQTGWPVGFVGVLGPGSIVKLGDYQQGIDVVRYQLVELKK